jgi:hypothetical protein
MPKSIINSRDKDSTTPEEKELGGQLRRARPYLQSVEEVIEAV